MSSPRRLPARLKPGGIRAAAAFAMGLGALLVLLMTLWALAAAPSSWDSAAVSAGDVHPLPTGYDVGAANAGLSVMKEAVPDPVVSGGRLTYTIGMTNTGATALHAVITDTLPPSVTLAKTSGNTVVFPNDRWTLTWTADIAAPGTWSRTIAVTTAEGYAGPLTNVVQVTSEEGPGATYTETSTSIVLRPTYVPLIFRNGAPMATLVGDYLRVETPCTTDPCMPGLIHAVLANDAPYYLTFEGSWLWRNRSWDGYTPELGDIVRVKGCVTETPDATGETFHELEVTSLNPALTPPPATANVVITDLLAYGAGGVYPGEYVEIGNLDTKPVSLEDWTLHNAAHRVFTFPDYVIQPGQLCRIYTDEDRPEWCGFNLGSDAAVWNDAQGCTYLRDDSGRLIDGACYCNGHTATMTISTPETRLGVSEPVTVTVTLVNRGCTALGLPQYRLYVEPDDTEPILTPTEPAPVYHHLAVGAGQSDAAQFTLKAVASGQAVLRASSSFEVHLGYPGPAYWGASSARPLTITVTP
jgi:uncharacterized repeat protein (TIGR01451 family)